MSRHRMWQARCITGAISGKVGTAIREPQKKLDRNSGGHEALYAK